MLGFSGDTATTGATTVSGSEPGCDATSCRVTTPTCRTDGGAAAAAAPGTATSTAPPTLRATSHGAGRRRRENRRRGVKRATDRDMVRLRGDSDRMLRYCSIRVETARGCAELSRATGARAS